MRWACIAILIAAAASPLLAHLDFTNSPTGPVYDLPGLHGTAAQINKQIHADTDQIKSNIADAQAAIKNIDDEIARYKETLSTQLIQTDSTYAYVCKTLDETKSQLATATNKVQIAELQNKEAGFSKRKAAIEDQNFPSDKQYAEFQKHRADAQSKLDGLQQALDKANAWRSKIAEAARDTETFTWPVRRDDTGIVGWAVIKEISNGGTNGGIVTASSRVFIPEEKFGEQEGITIIRGHPVPATYIISGMDTSKFTVGQNVLLDQNLAVLSVEGGEDEGGLTIRARRSPADIDNLLAVFREWQQPTTEP